MTNSVANTVLWFRRDLRLTDHPALEVASGAVTMVPLYVLDDRLLEVSPNRSWFLVEALRLLARDLEARGSGLLILRGRAEDIVPALAEQIGATAVHVTRDHAPFGRRRDRMAAEALLDRGVPFHRHPGLLVHEPEALAGTDGRVYATFSAFRRAWEAQPVRDLVGAPAALPPLPPSVALATSPVAILGQVRRPPTADRRLLPEPGEAAGRRRLESWLLGPIHGYADRRDRLDDPDGTSHLSPYLRFGLVSAAEAAVRAADEPGGRRFRSELAWRDFHAHQLFHYPDLAARPPRAQLDRAWGRDEDGLAAWRAGRTGYPVVDAAMRELAATGWIHNRARMIAASFLTKHLLVDWREGEAHFRRHLVDGDVAANVGNWQWVASVGVDAQPYFRIFNPTLQGERFDPEGTWVRQWVPELGRVPTRYVHRPWEMPPEVQAGAGCRIGVEYPAPIVDHADARSRALSAFGGTARDAAPRRSRVR